MLAKVLTSGHLVIENIVRILLCAQLLSIVPTEVMQLVEVCSF